MRRKPEPMRVILWCMIAAMLLIAIGPRMCGQVVATAHPQPRPSRHVRVWQVTVCNYGPEAITITQDRLFQEFGGRLAILNTYARGYEQTRTPKSVIGRVGDGLSNAGIAFAGAVGSGAIEYDGPWTTAAMLFGGGWKIARLVLRESDNLSLTGQPFWDERKVQIDAGGGCWGAAMAVLRPEDKAERKRLEANSLGIAFRDWGAEPAITGQLPMVEGLEPVWPRESSGLIGTSEAVLASFQDADCVARPSAVGDGCESWW